MKPEIDYEYYLNEITDYAVFTLDTFGNIISWNLGAERINGYSEAEVLQKHFSIFFPEESKKSGLPEELLVSAAASGRAEYSGWHIRKDGTKFYGNGVINAIYDKESNLIGFAKITRDLSILEENSEQISKSERKFRYLIESAPDAMIFTDANGIINLVNKQTIKLFGYTEAELYGRKIEMLMPERFSARHIKHRDEYQRNPKIRMMGEGRELKAKRKDGSEFDVEISLSPIKADPDDEMQIVAAIRDTTQRTRIENEIRELNRTLEQRVKERTEELEKSLVEKVTMLQEIHHRVKNNLQTVSSLLRIQSNKIPGNPAVGYLRASEQRIRSMALIHMQLYKTKDFSKINFSEYVEELCEQLKISFGIPDDKVKVNVRIKDIYFSIDTALPCGLMINELITNSLKHAFPGERQGRILIEIKKLENRSYELVYNDNGVGASEDKIAENPSKLGILLINTLVEQLEGDVETRYGDGAEFKLTFMDIEHKTHYRT
ncbi:MAG TPA: PAS domain S-box protein [Ignavibacteria bacterium]|nr:PAS domain S-box protein [Ignavibacteria bacterium]HMQ98441.1 PAS domain S-box protein [Ignavibacteria bacterium]